MRTTRRFPYPGNPPADTTARSAPAAASPARGPRPASNPIGARPGQKVVVESSTKNMLRIVVLVYLIPVVLFLAGYVIMSC
ncbi:MAG: SoxR reducing system RseC family protein [Dysosmobacter welbionis]